MNEQLESLYQKIDQRGRDALINHHEEVDHQLPQPAQDDRRSLTLIAHLPAHVSRNIKMGLQGLRMMIPELYYYPSSTMHITILDLLGQRPSDQELKKYCQQLSPLVEQFLPIQWTLNGIIASPAALMVRGFYSAELPKLRAMIRQQLPAHGLKVAERYQTISGHVTVARFPSSIQNPVGLLDFLEQNAQVNFGTFETAELELVIHDWYHRRVQSVATFGGH